MAVSAAFTYLMAHPDHPQMKNNMQFYKAMPQVKPEYYVNLEAKDYQVRGGHVFGCKERMGQPFCVSRCSRLVHELHWRRVISV